MPQPLDEDAASASAPMPSATNVPLREADVRGIREGRPRARRATRSLLALAAVAWMVRRRRR
ncbi:hypothetical protein BH18ACT1_BH18ACT1_06660 [soil metagenome]